MRDVCASPVFRASVLVRVAQKQLEAPGFPKHALNEVLVTTEAPARLPQLNAVQRDAVASVARTILTADAAEKREGGHSFEILRQRYILCGCWLLLGDARAKSTLEQLTRELRPGRESTKEVLSLNAAVLGTLSWLVTAAHRDRYCRWREETLKVLYQGTSPSSSVSTQRENDVS